MKVFKSPCTNCKRELYRRESDQWVDTVDRSPQCPGVYRPHSPGRIRRSHTGRREEVLRAARPRRARQLTVRLIVAALVSPGVADPNRSGYRTARTFMASKG